MDKKQVSEDEGEDDSEEEEEEDGIVGESSYRFVGRSGNWVNFLLKGKMKQPSSEFLKSLKWNDVVYELQRSRETFVHAKLPLELSELKFLIKEYSNITDITPEHVHDVVLKNELDTALKSIEQVEETMILIRDHIVHKLKTLSREEEDTFVVGKDKVLWNYGKMGVMLVLDMESKVVAFLNGMEVDYEDYEERTASKEEKLCHAIKPLLERLKFRFAQRAPDSFASGMRGIPITSESSALLNGYLLDVISEHIEFGSEYLNKVSNYGTGLLCQTKTFDVDDGLNQNVGSSIANVGMCEGCSGSPLFLVEQDKHRLVGQLSAYKWPDWKEISRKTGFSVFGDCGN